MNEKLAQAAALTKNFVVRHKTAITVVVTATVTTVACAAMAKASKDSTMEFIESKGLMDEYNAYFEEPTEIEA